MPDTTEVVEPEWVSSLHERVLRNIHSAREIEWSFELENGAWILEYWPAVYLTEDGNPDYDTEFHVSLEPLIGLIETSQEWELMADSDAACLSGLFEGNPIHIHVDLLPVMDAVPFGSIDAEGNTTPFTDVERDRWALATDEDAVDTSELN